MIKIIEGLADTKDVSDWENGFIASIVDITKGGTVTSMLSEKQVASIEKIYNKHFD
jgi:hypothetical protein